MGIHKTHHLLKVVWVVVLVIMNWENPKVFINASGAISSILHFDFFFSMMMWKIEARHTNWSFFYELTISVFFVFPVPFIHRARHRCKRWSVSNPMENLTQNSFLEKYKKKDVGNYNSFFFL